MRPSIFGRPCALQSGSSVSRRNVRIKRVQRFELFRQLFNLVRLPNPRELQYKNDEKLENYDSEVHMYAQARSGQRLACSNLPKLRARTKNSY